MSGRRTVIPPHGYSPVFPALTRPGNKYVARRYHPVVSGGSASGPGGWASFEAEALPHAPRLFRLAMWLERDRHEAEDLVQETLTQALQSFHRFPSADVNEVSRAMEGPISEALAGL